VSAIHELTASELLGHLASGELTSRGIVTSLRERVRETDRHINAFCMLRDEAVAEAAAADERRRRGEPLGPLDGLPITIKDNVAVARTAATLGLASRREARSSEDAVLVAQLKRLGAIVLGKTNVPQLLLAQETENAVFGVTNNPWNRDRVPGGSSGGEAAAVAAGMSPLGIGTDIGGSIRIPAHFCGIFGFKPTLDRWSNRGSHTGLPGQEIVRAQIGCLARTARDVALLWRSLDPVAQSAADPRVVPLPAADPDHVDLTGLTIGYFDDDPFLEPVPAIRRAVHQAREALQAAGAALVPHRPVASEDVLFLWLAAISADGGRTIERALGGEAPSPQLKPSRVMATLPEVARRLAGELAGRLGERRVARLLASLGEKRVEELWRLTQRRTELRLEEFDRWRRGHIDALICPPHVVAALSHRESGDFALSLGAEFRWTLLDFPAGVAPVTTVRPDDIGRYGHRADRIERKVAAIDQKSIDLPVGVQIVARPYHEHVVIAVMGAIEKACRGTAGYPRTPVV
jgi:fatty acid amide hydrolase